MRHPCLAQDLLDAADGLASSVRTVHGERPEADAQQIGRVNDSPKWIAPHEGVGQSHPVDWVSAGHDVVVPQLSGRLAGREWVLTITVVDVGDGACTVLRPGSFAQFPQAAPNRDLTVIDCGAYRESPDHACSRLMAVLGGAEDRVTTIVVTHFDADHYLGLIRLAELMKARGQSFGAIQLVAPRPPDGAQDYVVAYLALARYGHGLRGLDLASALRSVSGTLLYTPLATDSQFAASGNCFTVHWPPRRLPTGVASQVQEAMTAFDRVASKFSEAGLPALLNNLEYARNGWLGQGENVDLRRSDTDDLHYADGLDDLDFRWAPVQDLHAVVPVGTALPDSLQTAFGRAWRAFARANNNMSLVFDARDPYSFICFGDAGPPVLQWLGRSGRLAHHYDVMLAPHHGTYPLPGELRRVTASVCIAQNGRSHVDRWIRHTGTHLNSARCTCTATYGTHTIL
jgi:hypothetical protein